MEQKKSQNLMPLMWTQIVKNHTLNRNKYCVIPYPLKGLMPLQV